MATPERSQTRAMDEGKRARKISHRPSVTPTGLPGDEHKPTAHKKHNSKLGEVVDTLLVPEHKAARRIIRRSQKKNPGMASKNNMTLYERIIAYRKLKQGGRDDEEGKSSRNLERSDTGWGSVDISHFTNKRDDETDRTPSPQPTFSEAVKRDKDLKEGHDYQEKATARDVHVQLDDNTQKREALAPVHRASPQQGRSPTPPREQSLSRQSSNLNRHSVLPPINDSRQGETRQRVDSQRSYSEDRQETVVATAAVVSRNDRKEERETEQREERREERVYQDEKSTESRKEERNRTIEERSYYEKNEEERRSEEEKRVEEKRREEEKRVEEKRKEEEKRVEEIRREEEYKQKEEKRIEEMNEEKRRREEEEDRRKEERRIEERKEEKQREEERRERLDREKVVEAAQTTAVVTAASRQSPSPKQRVDTPPRKRPETPPRAQAYAPSPEVARSPEAVERVAAPAAAAPAAAKPRETTSKSQKRRSSMADEIDRLDKLVDEELKSIIGKGNNATTPGKNQEDEARLKDKIFNPSFQADMDKFLRDI